VEKKIQKRKKDYVASRLENHKMSSGRLKQRGSQHFGIWGWVRVQGGKKNKRGGETLPAVDINGKKND